MNYTSPKKVITYSDIDLNLGVNKLTNDIILKTNASDIRQSLKIILNSKFYSRCFHPEIGCYLDSFLFMQNDSITLEMIKHQLSNTISTYEPRVTLTNIEVESIDGIREARLSGVKISLTYTINETKEEDSFEYIVERLR